MIVRVINGTVGLPDKDYAAIIRRYHAGDLCEVDADPAAALSETGAGEIMEEPEQAETPEPVVAEAAPVEPEQKPKKPAAKKSTKSAPKKTAKAKVEEAPEEAPPELTASAVV